MSNREIVADRSMINPGSLEEIVDAVAKSSESYDQSCDRVLDGLCAEAMNLDLSPEERRENHKMQMDVLDKKAEKVTENRAFAFIILCVLAGALGIASKTEFCDKAMNAAAWGGQPCTTLA